jgi:hypothetical protein
MFSISGRMADDPFPEPLAAYVNTAMIISPLTSVPAAPSAGHKKSRYHR